MALKGIDSIVFGVEDLDASRRFLVDWGLTDLTQKPDVLVFETLDGSQVVVKHKSDPSLPPAIEDGNTVRKVIWGAENQEELDRTIATLKAGGATEIDFYGLVSAFDPNGMCHAVRVSKRRDVEVGPTLSNTPGEFQRVDIRGAAYKEARPIKIGHVVLFCSDWEAMRTFCEGRLGFVVSDEYPGFGVFLRCKARAEHHNAFLINRAGKAGIAHVAFTLADIHEVFGGGMNMMRKGWHTEIGPGRHPISSTYFWYFFNPLCAPLEYHADEDYCTEAWKPGQYKRAPELFAEWAIAGGIDGNTRRQVKSVDPAAGAHAPG